MTDQRQRQILMVLLVILSAVVGWRFVRPLLSRESAVLEGEAGSALGSIAVKEIEAVRLADLDRESAEFHLGRDPFTFFTPPAPKPTVAEKPQARKPPPPKPRPPAAATQGQGAGPVAQPPAVDVVYLGRFGPNDRPIAVFSDGRDIFNVLEGGVLKKHFVVDKIGYESTDLKFVDFPDTPAKRLAVGG